MNSNAPAETKPAFVLIEPGGHGLRLVCVNSAARKLGLKSGLAFTDARARVPDLDYAEIDRAADAKALADIARWLIRFAPLVAVDGVDGLVLETTGCDHLYGGEPAMLTELSRILHRAEIPHTLGLASTQVAAAAVARHTSGTIIEPGQEKPALADVSMSCLRLSEEAEGLLRRFGLNRIGQLYPVERKALARRFQSKSAADAVLLKRDQALGLRHDPMKPLRPVAAQQAVLQCPEPIATSAAIEAGLEKLIRSLCESLTGYGQGARSFTLTAFRADGGTSAVDISTARAENHSKHIRDLFRERIDGIDPGFGIDLLMLEARRTGPMNSTAVALSGDLAAQDTDLASVSALADRLTAKLGEGVVKISAQHQTHQPDQVEDIRPFDGNLGADELVNRSAGPRPVRLLRQPELIRVLAEVPEGPPLHLVWRRVARKIIKADGPERIAPDWWQYTLPISRGPEQAEAKRAWLTPKFDPRADARQIAQTRNTLEKMDRGIVVKNRPRARDYYRIEDSDGRRYWVFRRGLYEDGRGSAPEWYMHGLFA